ncbi:MAG: hypothetical protein R3268_00070 [Acidiferrobacterales bacterium]|nr:hypothetical protein [Acidiferrobacterales bacterium]
MEKIKKGRAIPIRGRRVQDQLDNQADYINALIDEVEALKAQISKPKPKSKSKSNGNVSGKG